jgi:hypothetical protein
MIPHRPPPPPLTCDGRGTHGFVPSTLRFWSDVHYLSLTCDEARGRTAVVIRKAGLLHRANGGKTYMAVMAGQTQKKAKLHCSE